MIVFQAPVSVPEHNSLAVKIGTYLEQKISPDYSIIYDTYCYISHEILERLGHFKNGDPHEYMQTRLHDLGAPATFIAEIMSWLLKQGTMPSSYAPDVAVVYESDYENRFRVPIWIAEITSKESRDYDLFFKAYLYERLGVKEYFVFETRRRAGNLLTVYRLESQEGTDSQYRVVRFENTANTVYSEILDIEIPAKWEIR